MIKGIGFLTFGLTIVLSAGASRADYVVYTNRASFEAAIQTETTETFNELGPNLQSFASGLSQANGLTQPLTITGSSSTLFSGSSSSLAGFYPGNGTYLLGPVSNSSTDGITVAFPTNTVTAAGADVSNFTVDGPISFSGTTSQGEQFSGTVQVAGSNPNATFGFLGVTTTTPTDYITSLVFSATVGSNHNVVIDNVSFGTAVPEPTSMALFGAGALLLGGGFLRRRARASRD